MATLEELLRANQSSVTPEDLAQIAKDSEDSKAIPDSKDSTITTNVPEIKEEQAKKDDLSDLVKEEPISTPVPTSKEEKLQDLLTSFQNLKNTPAPASDTAPAESPEEDTAAPSIPESTPSMADTAVAPPVSSPSSLSAPSPSPSPTLAPQTPAPVTPTSNASQLQALMDAYKGMASDQQTGLKAAQARANQNELNANLGQAFGKIASGLGGVVGGTAPAQVNDKDFYDALRKNAQSPVEQYSAQVADQKNDPNSNYSKTMRAYLAPTFQKLGITMDDTTPASVLEKIAPDASKQVNAQLKASYLQTLQSTKQDTKATQEDDKIRAEGFKNLKDMRTAVTAPSFKTARSAIGKNQANMDSADRALDILNNAPGGDLNNLNTRDANIVTSDLASIVNNGGAATVSSQDKLKLQTAMSELSKLQEKGTNEPVGAQLGAFLTQTRDTLQNQRALAQKQRDEKFSSVFKGFSPNVLSHPAIAPAVEELKAETARMGQQENAAPNNAASVTPPSSTTQDPKIVQYANDHMNGDYNAARALLLKRGYKEQQ